MNDGITGDVAILACVLCFIVACAFTGLIIFNYNESKRVQSEAVVMGLGYYDPEQGGGFKWDMEVIRGAKRID